MFWRLGFAHTSPVEQLLETEDFTLQQLLEEDDIIQECKQLNKKLIDFLAMPEQVEALIDYVTVEPEEDSEQKIKFLYPYKSSEVLAADLTAVYDCIFSNDNLLDKLFGFLEKEAPLNTLLAGYFSKIVSTLLTRRPEETLKVMQSRRVMDQLLRHLGAYSILDLLLKVVSEAEENVSESQMEWIYELDLVEKLVNKLDQSLDSDVHANASAALVGFLSMQQQVQWPSSLPSTQSRFVDVLLSAESVRALLKKLLSGSPSTLEHGLTVLVELVRHCANMARSGNDVMPTIDEMLVRLGDLVAVLRSPPPIPVIVNTTGTLDPPLGSNRLKILEVMHALIGLKNKEVDKVMIELGVLPTCLDLFFKYEWHNFLHNLVKKVVEIVVKGENEEIKGSLFSDGQILERIIRAHAENEEAEKQPKATRKGYMGQLREMANMIVTESSNEANGGAKMMQSALDTDAWREFVAEYLEKLNELHEKLIGRPQPGGFNSEDEDEEMAGGMQGLGGGTIGFEFRATDDDQEDLFGKDDEDDSDPEEADVVDQDEEGDTEMHMASISAVEPSALDEETIVLSESVSAMHIDVAGTPGDSADEVDSPEYNDINFWKPKMNWFQPELH